MNYRSVRKKTEKERRGLGVGDQCLEFHSTPGEQKHDKKRKKKRFTLICKSITNIISSRAEDTAQLGKYLPSM